MTILSDVQDYLTSIGGLVLSSKYDPDQLLAVIATEQELQAKKLKPGATGVAITEALCRRVYVNLSRRGYPLGVLETSGDSDGTAFIPTIEGEIRRLEAPWRRVTLG